MVDLIGVETRVMLLAAGLVFVWALLLGVQKYAQILASPNACAHPYTDIAHRAALMYSFALLLIAAFAELSTWDWRIDLAAGLALTTFFVAAIGSYQFQGLRQQTDNQLRHPNGAMKGFMVALIVAEIGGFVVLLAGFVKAWMD